MQSNETGGYFSFVKERSMREYFEVVKVDIHLDFVTGTSVEAIAGSWVLIRNCQKRTR